MQTFLVGKESGFVESEFIVQSNELPIIQNVQLQL